MPELEVRLNGTNENPFGKLWGISQNPFPQGSFGSVLVPYVLKVQSLGGEPIKSCDDIRERLKGFSKEFVELCCKRFEPGKMVVFKVKW